MGSEHYQLLCERIDKLEDWKAAALCAVSASKITPVIARLGLPDTWGLVDRCLEYAWKGFGRQSSDSEEGLRLTGALEATPEWQCEDNSFLPFAVTETLDLVKSAVLAVAVPSSAKENAKAAFDVLVGIASSYDSSAKKYIARKAAGTLDVRLQASEEESQKRLVKLLEHAVIGSDQTMSDLRREWNDIAEMFTLLLPMRCYEYVST